MVTTVSVCPSRPMRVCGNCGIRAPVEQPTQPSSLKRTSVSLQLLQAIAATCAFLLLLSSFDALLRIPAAPSSSAAAGASSTRIPLRRVAVDKHAPHPLAARQPFIAPALQAHVRSGGATGAVVTMSARGGRSDAFVAQQLQQEQLQRRRRRLFEDSTVTPPSNASTGDGADVDDVSSPPNVTAADSSGVVATAVATSERIHLRDYSDYMFLGLLGVGTPAQYFGCVFDTGSADSWIFSSAMNPTQRYPWLHYFDSALSSSFVPSVPPRPWSIRYGKGTAHGQVHRDSVRVGDILVHGQDIALTTDTGASTTFAHENEPIDGLFGLGFQNLTTKAFGNAFMPHARNSGALQEAVFSFHMGRSDRDPVSHPDAQEADRLDALAHPDSFFLLGAPDLSLAPHGISYVPIVDPELVEGRWVVEMSGLDIGGKLAPDFCAPEAGATRACFAWVDTGSSFILLPADKYRTLMELIMANRPDCSIDAKHREQKATCSVRSYAWLPVLSFRFASGGIGNTTTSSPSSSSSSFLLTPHQYVLDTTDDDGSQYFLLGFSPRRTATPNVDYDEIIIGDTFLKNYYTIFDMERYQIGFTNHPPPLQLSWWLLLLIAALTVAALAAGVAFVKYCCLRPVSHDSSVAAVDGNASSAASAAVFPSSINAMGASANGNGINGVHAASLSNGAHSRSGDAACDHDEGEGETHPRGYAAVSSVHADGDADEPDPHAGNDGRLRSPSGTSKALLSLSRSSNGNARVARDKDELHGADELELASFALGIHSPSSSSASSDHAASRHNDAAAAAERAMDGDELAQHDARDDDEREMQEAMDAL